MSFLGRTVAVLAACAALAAPAAAQWVTIEPGGSTVCSDGSPYRFFVHPGDPAKLLVEFEGGGGCWNDTTCTSDVYSRRITLDPEVARQQCPKCDAEVVKAATLTERFVYLRCQDCGEVWAILERREFPRPRSTP